MPKIENVRVYGLEDAIKASKYSYAVDTSACTTKLTPTVSNLGHCPQGSGHDNFLKGIIVQFDLTFSQAAWMQAERYHWFDIVSSQSKMHRITKLDIKQQCNRYVDGRVIDVVQEKVNEYNRLAALSPAINEQVAKIRKQEMDGLFLEIVYSTPMGFELTAAMTTNYQQLKTIYHQRRHHRLQDWQILCDAIETLPCWKELIG